MVKYASNLSRESIIDVEGHCCGSSGACGGLHTITGAASTPSVIIIDNFKLDMSHACPFV